MMESYFVQRQKNNDKNHKKFVTNVNVKYRQEIDA